MERVDSDDHPLSITSSTYSSSNRSNSRAVAPGLSSSSRRHPWAATRPRQDADFPNQEQQQRAPGVGAAVRSPAASLIQSAARSVLDDATPNSAVISEEDASEASSFADGTSGDGRQNRRYCADSPTASLQSLQTRTLPAIPDEQDRRRFIGCLAAVLASSYDYDTVEESDESVAWSGYTDEFYNDDDNDDQTGSGEGQRDNSDGSSPSNRISRTQSTTSDSSYSNRCASFESIGTESSSHFTSGDTRSQLRQPQQTRNSSRRARQRESMMSRQPTSGLFGSNNKEKAKLARQRHRSRRYEVLSNLLISSSELLSLDKTVARAFLPMLSRVLVPEIPARDFNKATVASTGAVSRRPPLSQRNGVKTRSRSAPSSPTHGNDQPVRKTSALNASFDGAESLVFPEPSTHSEAGVPVVMDVDSIDESQPPRQYLDNEDELKPFLESLTPGAGFRCISILLLQHLLTSEVGYDARIRHVLKKLSVLVLVHDMEGDPVERNSGFPDEGTHLRDKRRGTRPDMIEQATRKFEALEHSVARRLIRFSMAAMERKGGDRINRNDKNIKAPKHGAKRESGNNSGGITREQIVRGVKIGGAGIVAGTLFALTGGLAAPGIAMGVAAVAGAAAGTAAVATLTSAVVVTTIFGVGGGGLAAYKMHRRTQGLTEFEFKKETEAFSGPDNMYPIQKGDKNSSASQAKPSGIEAELFSVLCISGWLRDNCDYQRPWGLQPTSPRIRDRQESLERFYTIYSPDHVPKCEKILSSWRGEEEKLWQLLREKYGSDPDSLFPLADGPRLQGALTLEQEEVLDKLFVELGYNSVAPNKQKQEVKHMSPFEKMKSSWRNRHSVHASSSNSNFPTQFQRYDSVHGPSEARNQESLLDTMYSYDTGGSQVPSDDSQQGEKIYKPPKHLNTVWDYRMTYGGEMYTVKWESELLKRICDCVMDLAMDVVSGATRQILKQTVLSTLLASFMWPSYLLNVANMIDGDWTLAVERADEAGKVLAKTLLFSRAGRRPVTLVGYSFGARIIYSCLKELARYQEEWEWFQELLEESETGSCSDEARLSKYQAKMKGMREPASIIEDAVLMGLPNHLNISSWRACRQVVAGRLVNCYSTKDLILSLMFQAKRFSGGSLNNGMGSILKPVCGTTLVNEPGVENVDCSDLILGHQDYCFVTGKILKRIRFGEALRCSKHNLVSIPDGGEISETAKILTY